MANLKTPSPSEPVAGGEPMGRVWWAFLQGLLTRTQREERPGSVVYLPSGSDTTGYLQADGSNVSRTTYASLFAVYGTNYGAGDGSTTFGLPDIADVSPVSGPDILAYVKV